MPFVSAKPPTRRLLLASRSPRRALLLGEAGFVFERFDPPFSDPADPNEAFAQNQAGPATALRLAQLKADSVPDDALPPETVLLCADTIGITPDGKLIGTPETPEQALAMLRGLVGRDHEIVTGVALRAAGGESGSQESFADIAEVNVGQIDDQKLRDYVDSGQWRGKAGGYNLAERLDAGWPIQVTGDPGTVMGLPMRRLTPKLIELGVRPTRAEATPSR